MMGAVFVVSEWFHSSRKAIFPRRLYELEYYTITTIYLTRSCFQFVST